MSFYLTRPDESDSENNNDFTANIRTYSALFKIALVYGFEPKGIYRFPMMAAG